MAYVNLGQVIYPIGAIFASTSSTSPSSMFGGTWSQIVDDACLMACPENSGTYGGSKKIMISHLPPHRHTLQNQVDNFELSPADQTTILCGQGSSKIFAWPDSKQSTYLTGGGQTTCLTPTDAICGGEQLNSSDASCVTSKTSKSELIQVLKQFAHSQLEQYTNLLVQPVQPASMAEDGPLSQMVDSLDRKGLGIILAEKMSTNSLLRKCQAINTDLQEGLILLHILVIVGLLNISTRKTIMPLFILQVVMPRTITFPHIEPAIAGIELPNILGGVLC